MINLDFFSSWSDLDNEIKLKKSNETVTKYLPLSCHNNVFISNDFTNNRYFSIEFNPETLKYYNPRKINGIDIVVKENASLDKSKSYLVIENFDPKFDNTFISFSALIFDSLINSKNDKEALERIELAFEEYHNFYSFKKELSREYEQGIVAELIYLYNLINEKGEQVVYNWFGSEKNKHDFVFENYSVEIKSTRNQEQDIIYVSNENQLDSSLIDKLLLSLYVFEENIHGISVGDCIKLIRAKLVSYDVNKIFNLKLIMREIDPENYEGRYKFSLQYVHTYLVDDNFPKITKNNIPSNAYDVKYRLNLSGIDYLEKEQTRND